MQFDGTIPLWPMLIFTAAIVARLVRRSLVPVSELLLKICWRIVSFGMPARAREMWRCEQLNHALEGIRHDINTGLSDEVTAWHALQNAVDLTFNGLGLRSSYLARAGERELHDRRRIVAGIALRGSKGLFAFSPMLALAGVLALVAVLVPGVGYESGGATRWIRFGYDPLTLKPADIVGLLIATYVAAWLASRPRMVESFWTGFFNFSFLVGVVCGLVLLQPDPLAAVMILITMMALMVAGGGAFRDLLAFIRNAGAAAGLLVLSGGYRADALARSDFSFVTDPKFTSAALAYVSVAFAFAFVCRRRRLSGQMDQRFHRLVGLGVMTWAGSVVLFLVSSTTPVHERAPGVYASVLPTVAIALTVTLLTWASSWRAGHAPDGRPGLD